MNTARGKENLGILLRARLSRLLCRDGGNNGNRAMLRKSSGDKAPADRLGLSNRAKEGAI